MFATGTTRVGGMKAVLKIIHDLGYDPEPMIRRAGLDVATLSDPDFIVPSSIFGKLFAHCVSVTGCDHFGMLVGSEGSLSWLGRVGFIARNSETVGLALQSIGAYFHLHDRAAVVELKQSGGNASLSYSLLSGMEAQDQWLSGVMCCATNIMRELCGPGWTPLEVTFAIPRPANTRPFENFFRAKLTFDAAETALLFQQSWTQHPVHDAQPELRRLLLKDAEQANTFNPADFPLDVGRMVRTHISAGKCSADKISLLLGISPRALYDRLASHGTSFKQLVETARFEMAKQLLQNTALSLSEISERLDYSEISAFTRAFSRWSGMPPGDWRRRGRE